jgi:hypothetical protein
VLERAFPGEKHVQERAFPGEKHVLERSFRVKYDQNYGLWLEYLMQVQATIIGAGTSQGNCSAV